MSIIGSNVLAGASGSGVEAYEIEQSLRFNNGDSAHLHRTPGSAGSQTTFTLSVWVKSSVPSSGSGYFYATHNGSRWNGILRRSGNYDFGVDESGGSAPKVVTNAKLRDPSAWYHLVMAYDTTQATSTDRVKIWINGELQSINTGAGSYPSQNHGSTFNRAAKHWIGALDDTASVYYTKDFYLAEYHLLDGTAVTDADDFGEYDANGVWRPIEYEGGNYGTTGFYLKFDETATNGIGHDHSGNGNNWTASGFTTSGTGTDVMSDTPTKNFPTLNPLDNLNGRYSNDPTNGNLEVSIPSDSVSKRNFPGFYSTQAIPTTGKFYFEFEPSQEYTTINIVDVDEVGTISSGDHVGASDKLSFQYFCESGNYRFNGSSTASGLGGFSSGSIYGVAVDLENETFRVYENGVAGSELSVSGYLGADARIAPSIDSSGASGTVKMNFGQREFAHPPGTASFTDHFAVVTFTAGTTTVTGCGFQPDLVWVKNRDQAYNYRLIDVVRGVKNDLYTNTTTVEQTNQSDSLLTFTSDGFTHGKFGSADADNMVAWCFKAGGTPSDNTDGNVTTSVSANQTSGFSIVSYQSSTSTKPLNLGHGLGEVPKMIITKNRDSSSSWIVYHSALGATKALSLNGSGAAGTSTDYWNDTAPTSSVFTVFDSTGTHAYGSSDDMIAYCFAEKSGYTKIGSYTANNSTNGPEVDLGFRPAFLLLKANASANWQLFDSQRRSDDGMLRLRSPYLPTGEGDPGTLVFTNTGFRIISNDADVNSPNGTTFIYLALSESFVSGDYKALNTANLPAPTVKDGSDYMNTVLYTGNGGSGNSVTGVGFQSDFIWFKSRSFAAYHSLYNSVTDSYLASNATEVEASATDLTVGTDGFTHDASSQRRNSSGETYAAWNWLAGGSSSSNTDGSVNSTVSANPTAGFSVITYQANGTAGMSFGHGLGVAPDMVICKNRDDTNPWIVWHKVLPETNYVLLNVSNKQQTQSDWISTSSTTITWDSLSGSTTTNGSDYVVFAFAEIEGYSRISEYPGTGNSDGPYVHCGFRPSVLIIKNYAGGSETNWVIKDTTRDTYNPSTKRLNPNQTYVESDDSNVDIDFLANGFKVRSTNTSVNESGSDYLFIAFAENPFGGSGVSPVTAR